MITDNLSSYNHQISNGKLEENGEEVDEQNNSAKLFERSRIKALADEREAVQKKTFTKWVNSHLGRVGCKIQDLYVDLRDGKMLIKLLEVLSGEKLPNPTKGKMRIHCLENVDKSLTFLNEQKVHLENMGAHDIVDGNPRLTLGLIWTIILRFQIQGITVEQEDNVEIKSAKDALLLWCQMKTAGYENINVRNFTTSWRDGLAFNAIIHKHRPDLIDYKTLIKSNPTHNLNNAFNVAEDKLGLSKLLDPEDVNIEYPDEKSIITYVVTYYHYFSKMKAESVQGRRAGRVINQCRDVDRDILQYETIASNLLSWIQMKIADLKDHKFANSLTGVQEQLASFNLYRTAEKPGRFQEKGDLEIKLFQIQSRMRANNQKPYTPKEGALIADINRAWEQLEKAEHERELALREELIRQEKLETLAARCERKAAMREAWLIENQRLVSQDNFGYDLPSVEAATKKHEAIETDINAYEERVVAIVNVARELETENYHDVDRINLKKDNVLRLWQDLLELLRSRRLRLDSSLQLQKTFQEMLYILDWIDEIKVRMQNKDLGKHLAGVEDLKQKHALLDSDIAIIKKRIDTINDDAGRFVDGDFEGGQDGYRPCDPDLVSHRIEELNLAYDDLLRLASSRWAALDQSEKMWQFDWEVANEETWMKEREKLLLSPDIGHDLTSVQLLINKQKTDEDEMRMRRTHQLELLEQGRDLIGAGNVAADNIKRRMNDLEKQMNDLDQLSEQRRKKLLEALKYHQLFSDADDVDAWMTEMLNLVSNPDVGKDEAGVLSLVKKHQKLTEELDNYNEVIKALQNQANQLSEQDRKDPEVMKRLSTTEQRYNDLKQRADSKKRRLMDALALYKLSNEADGVEQWIVEKEKLIHTMVTTEDVEEVEVLKARYDTLENEVQSNADRVVLINQLSEKLLTSEHPDADAINQKQKQLNEKWSDLRRLADKKKDAIDSAHDVNKFHAEAQETMTWITDKEKLIESTDELGNDLTGMIALQRRLSGLNRDLGVIESKINYLKEEGDRLKEIKPAEGPAIKQQLNRLTEIWLELKTMLKSRDERLGEVSELQKFLTDLDHFQQWLSRTQTSILSEDIPNNVAEADDFLEQHAAVRKEIDAYAPQYEQMKKYGDGLVAGQDDPQFMFLRERLKALNNDWNDLKKMWDSKQNLLMQSKNLQEFMKEMNHVELLLSQEDNFLSKDEVPQTIEQGEDLLYKHNTFATTLNAHREKINHALQLGNQLIKDGNYLAPKVQQKINLAEQRFGDNEKRAEDQLERVKDHIEAIKLFQDCDELSEWISEKLLTVQDETYREARNEHSKWLRHQALELELKSNKERLNAIVDHAKQLEQERPDLKKTIDPRIKMLMDEWANLQDQTKAKGERLFNANKHIIYEKNVDDIDGWIDEIESQIVVDEIQPDSYIPFNIIIKKQNLLESQLKIKEHQVQELEIQSAVLDELDPDEKEKILQKKHTVQQRFNMLLEPLLARRKKLDESFRARQFELNAAEELMWIGERLPLAKSTDGGKNLQATITNRRKYVTLNQEIASHQPRFESIIDQGSELIDLKHPNSVHFTLLIEEMRKKMAELKDAMHNRDALLQQTEKLQQYLHDAGEAEAWLGEQELYLLSNDRPKDEQATTNMLNKHASKEKTLNDFTDDVDQLAERAKQLSADKNLDGNAITKKQERVEDKLAALKDMASQQRIRLYDMLKLYKLHYEIDDLEQWIAEREAVASSHEFGQNYEHVCELRNIFNDFSRETEAIGQDRVAAVNDICDQLIDSGHSEAPTIAEWKDGINESWSDLLELIETRTLALTASYERFKFFNDCDDVLERIHEKKLLMPGDDLPSDSTSSILLQRRLNNFEHDLVLLGTQVQGIQDSAAKLIVSYSGEKATAIQQAENRVVEAWKGLHGQLDTKRLSMNDLFDGQRFFAMARDLEMWMNDVERQMIGIDKPRDVAGVELLMSNHKSLKAEIDSRDENGTICSNLGKDLYRRGHIASPKIKERLIQLAQQRGTLSDHWQERSDYLQIIWEVYQFARDSTLAESWISTHEPQVQSSNYGSTIDAVENLIKRHDALEKTMATQEERFEALKNLTTLEILEREKKERPEGPPAKPSMIPFYMKEWVPGEHDKPKPRPVVEPPARPPTSPKPVDTSEVIVEMLKPIPGFTDKAIAKPSNLVLSESLKAPKTPDPTTPKTPDKSKSLKLGRSASAGKDKKPTDPLSPRSPEDDAPVILEGYLNRKHVWETMIKKSSNRSWEKIYATVNQARKFSFYKDAKHSKGDGRSYLHNESPIDLDVEAAIAIIATDYVKRQNVFRLKLKEGAEYLFQCKDETELNNWVRQIGSGNVGESHFQTLPTNLDVKRDEPKRRSLLSFKKK